LQVVSVSVRSSAAGPGLGLDDRSFYMSPVYLGFERNCQFPCVLQTILNISENNQKRTRDWFRLKLRRLATFCF